MDKSFEVVEAVADGRAEIPRVKKRKDGFNRQDLVNAFANAFEMIGGTTRLALWANANPDKFYPLAAKLLPSQTAILGVSGQPTILHAIPPTPLDHHPGFAAPLVEEITPEHVEADNGDA
jgi:hypothetical protein